MKRSAAPLVDYVSEDGDDDVPLTPSEPLPTHPVAKKRKLPALSASLTPSTPIDNPALHQGRTRTTPYIEGQYAAYVFVPVALEPKSKLLKLVRKVYRDAKKTVPILHPLQPSSSLTNSSVTSVNQADKESTLDSIRESAFDPTRSHELHVSLSRPIFLRAHQVDELKRVVRSIANAYSSFSASFATISNLINDERTRTFLTLEVGAGHSELSSLTMALTPHLQALRQKSFYDEPRFHASFAWALLSRPDPTCSEPSPSRVLNNQNNNFSDSVVGGTPLDVSPTSFPTIPALPPMLVPGLVSNYASQLASPHIGTFEVTHIGVKIGKNVSRFKLDGVH